MPHPPRVRNGLSRRTTLLALPTAASAIALAGCRWGPEADEAEVPSGATPPAPDADRELADRAVVAITSTASIVAGTFEARPPLRERLAGFAALHETQLRQLEADPGSVAGEPRAWAGVLDAERTLQDQLVELAAEAQSGPLARILGSMAAGVAQLVAVAAEGA